MSLCVAVGCLCPGPTEEVVDQHRCLQAPVWVSQELLSLPFIALRICQLRFISRQLLLEQTGSSLLPFLTAQLNLEAGKCLCCCPSLCCWVCVTVAPVSSGCCCCRAHPQDLRPQPGTSLLLALLWCSCGLDPHAGVGRKDMVVLMWSGFSLRVGVWSGDSADGRQCGAAGLCAGLVHKIRSPLAWGGTLTCTVSPILAGSLILASTPSTWGGMFSLEQLALQAAEPWAGSCSAEGECLLALQNWWMLPACPAGRAFSGAQGCL